MTLKQIINNILKRKKNDFPISAESFLDVHNIYDKINFQNDWKKLIDSNHELWNTALNERVNGKKILMASLSGGFSHRPLVTVDAILSLALTLRGANVDALLCDHVLPVCMKAEYAYIKPEVIYHSQLSQTLCKGCYKDNSFLYSQLGLSTHLLGNYITYQEKLNAKEISNSISLSAIKDFKLDGVSVGEHATTGTTRYFSNSDPSKERLGEEISRRYLEASIIAYYSLKSFLEKNKYDGVCMTHGVFTPYGIVNDVCTKMGIPVVCWGVSYQKQKFFFTHGNPLQFLLHEDTKAWEDIKWTDKQKNQILDYIRSRWYGGKDWLSIQKDNKNITFKQFAADKKINLDKPIIGLLTNIVWEAIAEYKSRIFPDMLTWIKKTIIYFKSRKDLQLLIRIHPAESQGNVSRQLAIDEINKMFKKLPDNVFIINSDDNVSTYEAMEFCDSVIIYQTQAGLELAVERIPIILAGDAWMRNKGIGYEPETESEYFKLLDTLPFKCRMSDDKVDRARKYAYHAFFRKMIPISFFEGTNDWMLYKPNLSKLDQLLPGFDTGMDVICDGILNGNSFIYPAENVDG